MDNADGFPGVVVYGDTTFTISSQQDAEWTASDEGQGPYSSVQPFQFTNYESEEAPVGGDPPETVRNSLPIQGEEEEDEEQDDRILDTAYINMCPEFSWFMIASFFIMYFRFYIFFLVICFIIGRLE